MTTKKPEPTPGGRKPPKKTQAFSKPLEYRFFVRIWLGNQAEWAVCGVVSAYDDIHAIHVARAELLAGWPAIAGATGCCPATATQLKPRPGA
jgi:hypothetical protein